MEITLLPSITNSKSHTRFYWRQKQRPWLTLDDTIQTLQAK